MMNCGPLPLGIVLVCSMAFSGCGRSGTTGGVQTKTWDQYVADLKSSDAKVRTIAAQELAKLQPMERSRAMGDLQAALKNETDPTAKAAMEEALKAAKASGGAPGGPRRP